MSTGFYCDHSLLPLLPRFVLLFRARWYRISLLCSTGKENLCLVFSLKEGRLILIASNVGFGLWFAEWKMFNIFYFSCPHRQKGVLPLRWWIHSAKPRRFWQLISVSSLFSLRLYHSLPPLSLAILLHLVEIFSTKSQ